MECALCKIQYVGKAKTAFNIRLNNNRKDVNNPKPIPAAFHFRKPGHSFNLHVKFTLMEQLSNIHTTDKETLKFRLKRCKDFWIQLQFGNETFLSNHVTKKTCRQILIIL